MQISGLNKHMFQGNPPKGGGVPETLIQKDILRMENTTETIQSLGYEFDKQGQFINEDVVLYLQSRRGGDGKRAYDLKWQDYTRIYDFWDAQIATAMVGSMPDQYRVMVGTKHKIGHGYRGTGETVAVPDNPNMFTAKRQRELKHATPWVEVHTNRGYRRFERHVVILGQCPTEGHDYRQCPNAPEHEAYQVKTESLQIMTLRNLTNPQPWSQGYRDTLVMDDRSGHALQEASLIADSRHISSL